MYNNIKPIFYMTIYRRNIKYSVQASALTVGAVRIQLWTIRY